MISLEILFLSGVFAMEVSVMVSMYHFYFLMFAFSVEVSAVKMRGYLKFLSG